jgi:glycosyltransferase involved in cell wall biosynthesis
MPMAILEAMAAGAVPVATAISSVPEIVDDKVNGFLMPAGSAKPWELLLRLVREPEAVAEASRHAVEFARAKFDARTNYGRLSSIYALVTRQPASALRGDA